MPIRVCALRPHNHAQHKPLPPISTHPYLHCSSTRPRNATRHNSTPPITTAPLLNDTSTALSPPPTPTGSGASAQAAPHLTHSHPPAAAQTPRPAASVGAVQTWPGTVRKPHGRPRVPGPPSHLAYATCCAHACSGRVRERPARSHVGVCVRVCTGRVRGHTTQSRAGACALVG